MATKPDGIEIVSDTGWQHNARTSIPRRGINDYEREIEFAAALTSNQLTAVCAWLAADNCPGWTGVTGQPLGGMGHIRFHTTYDSSD